MKSLIDLLRRVVGALSSTECRSLKLTCKESWRHYHTEEGISSVQCVVITVVSDALASNGKHTDCYMFLSLSSFLIKFCGAKKSLINFQENVLSDGSEIALR